MRLWVSMGVKPGGRADAPLRPRLVELDADTGAVLRTLEHQSPPGSSAGPGVHQEFTAGALIDGVFWQPTHTELLALDPTTMAPLGRVDHPLLHGVHSVAAAPDGGLVVSCAGLDSVVTLGPDGTLRDHRFLGDGAFTDRHPVARDFRRVPYDALKPHSHHPNHAHWVDGSLLVTCFETRRAHRVVGEGPDLPLPEGIPHDGRLRDGLLWFTQVDGRVIAVHPDGRRDRVIDLTALDPSPGLMGWCRGIEKVGHRLFVGFTQLRSARHREVARWLIQGEAGRKRPSRVVEIDLRGPRIVREHLVGNAAGATIYGLWAFP